MMASPWEAAGEAAEVEVVVEVAAAVEVETIAATIVDLREPRRRLAVPLPLPLRPHPQQTTSAISATSETVVAVPIRSAAIRLRTIHSARRLPPQLLHQRSQRRQLQRMISSGEIRLPPRQHPHPHRLWQLLRLRLLPLLEGAWMTSSGLRLLLPQHRRQSLRRQ